MHSHITGGITGTRLGTIQPVQSVPITFADATGVAKKLLTISASTLKPTAFRLKGVVIITANDAVTSATLSIGITGAGYTDLMNAQDLKGTAGTNMTLAANPIVVVTADTDIYAISTYVGTPTAGRADAFIEMWEVNRTEPNAQGA